MRSKPKSKKLKMGKIRRKRRGLLLHPVVTPNPLLVKKAVVMRRTSVILRSQGERADQDQRTAEKREEADPERTEEIDLESVPEEIAEVALEKIGVIKSVIAGEADQDLDNDGVFLN